jgi:hypothetical protein
MNPRNRRIAFTTRAGFRIVGVVVDDIGHALVLRVEKGPRKSYVGKALCFPKHDMSGLVIEGAR